MSEDNEKNQPKDNEPKADSIPVADRAGEPLEDALKDPGLESLKKFGPLIIAVVVAVFAIFAFTWWTESSNLESQERVSQTYVAALGSTENLLAFAEANPEEPLAGVALYRAAVSQYDAKNFDLAATTFGRASTVLLGQGKPLPLAGRALLGQGISLIQAGKSKDGKALLEQLAKNDELASSSRGEAWYHLGIQALVDNEDATMESVQQALSKDTAFEAWRNLLKQRKDSRDVIAIASQRRKVPVAEKNLQAGQEFLAENKKRKGVVTLASGLQYEMLVEGNGTSPMVVDEVEVHYHGTLIDGEVFDSSIDRGSPSEFSLKSVIAGWTEGLQLMKVGGKRKFFIPADLAYKKDGKGRSIGPNVALVFEIELLKVTPPPPPLPEPNEANASTPSSPLDGNASVVVPIEGNGTIITPPSAPENNGSN